MSAIKHSTSSTAPQSSLTLSYLPIADLKPDPRNARVHSKKQVQQIAQSILSFGFNVPILVDAASNVVAGHGRLLAAKKLGWTEVPTIRLDHLTETQRRAFMIADNRLTEIGAWDDRLLAEQLKELSVVDLTFDIEATGFDAPQIDLMIASLTVNVEAATDEKPLPCVSGPPVSRAGDLWALGRHKVLCGDATDAASFANLIGSEEVAVVFTDPPYNVPIDGHVSGLGGLRHREFSMAVGELSPSEFTGFLEKALGFCARHSRSGALVYACMDWRHIEELQAAARASGLEMVNLCVWAKPNAGMGSFYRSQHELVFVFKNGPGSHVNNVQLGRHGRNRTNVWSYANGPGFGRAGEEGRLAALHPTVKPVPMIADALLDSSQRGDIALDPFLGSGATLMAAERTGRRCFGLELDPLYVDVIVRRWQAYTGDVARHLTTGATFDETETARTAVAEQVAA
jgi:DNA modification methylase